MIREARIEDRLAVVAMLKRFHAAADLPFHFSPAHAERQFLAYQAAPDRLCLVTEGDDRPVGVLMAHAVEHPFSGIRMAGELCWWIDPAHRGHSARSMVAAYERWAVEQGCAIISLAGLGSDPKPTALYQRLGYQPAELHFSKTL
ncbi:GNAT family N-acetyltransferase [Georhizobium profundi]|uniref:GNAT family N-acetyltransferase n=1 Tax=Georhizobium profundi TaxID=2341112 RepID=A0A3S9B5N0_9HYPH|nr:GNAT family N-acetyltransferase [Georhizobium profundi]AZN72249.1 GNAT family N-acetyltransferase [Georhizobium profundi]